MKRTINTRVSFKRTDELLDNPYIGFTSFQHFRDEPLFSDTFETGGWMKERYPVYDWVEQKGREQGFHPDTSVAYFRFMWRDFEPNEGEYNFAFVEEILQKAAEHNQTVIFRMSPYTGKMTELETEDVPEWLKSKTSPRTAPTSYRPDRLLYLDPLFFEYYGKAIMALGEKFDGDKRLYAVDVALAGPWGEGQGYEEVPVSAMLKLIETYALAFRKTHVLGQLDRTELIDYASKIKPLGWRTDGFPNEGKMHYHYPEKIFEVKDAWKTAPVSIEAWWYINEWKRQGWDIDYAIEQSLKWHISTFNNKSSACPLEWKDKIEGWLKKMGYRFAVRNFKYPAAANAGDCLQFSTWLENVGVAPIYYPLPFTLRLKNENYEKVFETDIDARNWLPGDRVEKFEIRLPDDISQGKYAVECRLGGGEYPIVKFAMDTPRTDDGYYYLAEISVEK